MPPIIENRSPPPIVNQLLCSNKLSLELTSSIKKRSVPKSQTRTFLISNSKHTHTQTPTPLSKENTPHST